MNFMEGPAILSRFPIVAWEAHHLPRCASFFDPRVLVSAELGTPWGRLWVSSTHTSHGACEAPRIADLLRRHRGPGPAMLMGDFNAVETSPGITTLTGEAGFIDVFRAANPTEPGLTVWQRIDVPVSTVARRVDFIFLVPGMDVPGQIRESRVVLNAPARLPDGRTVWPSDHYGVLAEVEVFGPGTSAGE
jgi:endonuclease/exonuclease/phosphatase family metal-dependent hydrolase